MYPICTIRSTPDKPVHCIVWAKELFKLILGPPAESMLFESAIGGEKGEEDVNDRNSSSQSNGSPSVDYSATSEYMKYVNFPDVLTADSLKVYAKSLFVAIFHTEVTKQIEAGVYKTSKKTPKPLDVATIEKACETNSGVFDVMLQGDSQTKRPSSSKGWERRVWSVEESLAELTACVAEVWTSSLEAKKENKADMLGNYVFDKDFRYRLKVYILQQSG